MDVPSSHANEASGLAKGNEEWRRRIHYSSFRTPNQVPASAWLQKVTGCNKKNIILRLECADFIRGRKNNFKTLLKDTKVNWNKWKEIPGVG